MILSSIIIALWSARILANALTYIQLWYIKEYRLDRVLIHLRTKQGRRLFLSPFKRPPVTPKTIVLFACFLLSAALVLVYVHGFILVKVLVLDILTFPIISVFVMLFKLPTFLYHSIQIKAAVSRLSGHKKMKVIGITGSYGKTSVKEIAFDIISQKFLTIKTEASKNSPIAIAEVILSQLLPEHEVFIVEMGAYKTGEISAMSAMVHPQIAVLTAINAQHQDLFGGINQTMKAKYELVLGLDPGGVVIANADNEYVRTMCEWAIRDGRTVYYYSVKDVHAYLYAQNARMTGDTLSFTVRHNNKSADFTVPLLGVHHVSNILAGMAAAMQCGMSFEDVTHAVPRVRPIGKTMHPRPGVKGAAFIDDSFNNNPDAAKAALTFLSARPHRRVFVFQPMIELGSFERISHREVGHMAAGICDEIILTNDNFYDSFLEGALNANKNVSVRVLSAKKGAAYIYAKLHQGDTVLFKGKESARIMDNLLRMEHKS